MRYRHAAVATGAFALAATLLTGTPAGAQDEPPAIEVLPTSGPPGSVIAVSGTGCASPYLAGAELYDPMGGSLDIAEPESSSDGTWSVELTVPQDALPGKVLEVRSWCEHIPGDNWRYADVEFLVTDAPPGVIPMDVTPTDGPVGTAVSVSGTECTGDAVEYALLAGTGVEDITAVVDAWSTAPAEDGSWSGELVVYDTMVSVADGAEVDVVPGGDYVVAAACAFYPDDVTEEIAPDHIVFSEPVDFEITGDGTAPRTDPPPATEIVTLVPRAQPAAAVVAEPTYTG